MTTTATLYGPKPACVATGAPVTTLPTWHNASQWNGSEPVCYGDWRRFSIPADSTPELKRRSESKYSPDMTEATARVACGQTSRIWGWVQPKLGPASMEPRHWHCVTQLHGPRYDGVYALASVALMVREGFWCLEFGDPATPDVKVAPYVDSASVYVDLSVTAGETAATGRITGAVAKVSVDVALPTFWHQFLVWSNGIYRGSGLTEHADGGPQPTYLQEVFWKVNGLVNTWPVAP